MQGGILTLRRAGRGPLRLDPPLRTPGCSRPVRIRACTAPVAGRRWRAQTSLESSPSPPPRDALHLYLHPKSRRAEAAGLGSASP